MADYAKVSGTEVVVGGRRFTQIGRPVAPLVRRYVPPPTAQKYVPPAVNRVKGAHPLTDTALVRAAEGAGASALALQAQGALAEIYAGMRACSVLPGLGVLKYGRCFSRQPILPIGANPTFDRSPMFAVVAIEAARGADSVAPDLRARFKMPDDIDTYAPGVVSVVREFEVDGLDHFTIPPCRNAFDILTGLEVRGESVESVRVHLAAEISPPPGFGGGRRWVEIEVPVTERPGETGRSFTAELNLPSIAYAYRDEHLPRVQVTYRDGADEKCALLLAGVFCSDGGHGIPALDLAVKKRDGLRMGVPTGVPAAAPSGVPAAAPSGTQVQVEELGAW
jgi:hypothetical protein